MAERPCLWRISFILPASPAAERVTLINTVPSVLTELLALGPLPASVRTINLAGEALPQALVTRLYQQETLQSIYNLYGPTEDTTYSTVAFLPRTVAFVSIGRPVANGQAYILDEYLQPVPVGVVGELYLAGDGLARGYLNRMDLTAERFLPHPFSKQAGERLYKTGDQARFRADGQIEYLGRKDQQIKLRGFRIELGEIETVLRHYPGVQDTAVVVQELSTQDSVLVAYVVAANPLSEADLHRYLKEHFPHYMVPSAVVLLAALPLTTNGKVDRRALPVS